MAVRFGWVQVSSAVLIGSSIFVTAHPAAAQTHPGLGCWEKLAPQTLVEVNHVQKNSEHFASRQVKANATRRPAGLLLSYGRQRTAFSAGLIVGWGETGHRPTFDLVTAVGPSAVIAPFAFVGSAGDQAIAESFHCKAQSWTDMVHNAMQHLNERMLARIRQGHDEGRRLIIALKGSAARPQTVWDIGKIAASRHSDALKQIKTILAASVDLTTRVPTPGAPIKAGQLSQRNHTFRVVGAGQPFVFQPRLGERVAHWFVVHNSVLFDDEVARYSRQRRSNTIKSYVSDEIFLRPLFDVLGHARQSGAGFRLAVVQPRRWFYPLTEFDQKFMREVFLRAYRYARMGRLMQSQSIQ